MILERIVARRRELVAEERQALPEKVIREEAERCQRETIDFHRALADPGVSLIAEIKKCSPSAGDIRIGLDVGEFCRIYAENGAAAVSVLTEPAFFGGSLDDLETARRSLSGSLSMPILRKDFIISTYQVYQAFLRGTDALLLIVACLDDSELLELMSLSNSLGVQPLVEVHDVSELERALAAGAEVIGVNNRDLRSFQVNLDTTVEIAGCLDGDVTLVSESGIRTAADIYRLAEVGVDAVLVGESILRSPDPSAKVRELAEAGNDAS